VKSSERRFEDKKKDQNPNIEEEQTTQWPKLFHNPFVYYT
jgi:hypothetical protein